MNSLMLCPWCGKELEEGTFRSRGGNCFLPLHEKVPLTYLESSLEKRNAISLPPYPLNSTSYPTAYVCRFCKKIIIPY
ncbi:MAG: PF20097 family protein [Clostridiaceae bacterium]